MLLRSRIRTYDPRMRLRSNWRFLSAGELRLLMSGLANWERRSPIGPVRSRIRRMRRDAVEFYRKVHGSLAEDRLWVAPRLPTERGMRDRYLGRHDPRKERQFGVLWHET